jgi:single-strand DNA-binding protein
MTKYNLNHVCLSGTLAADPVKRETPTGKSLVKFALAVHEMRRGRDGAADTMTYYFDVTAWGAVGENTAKYSAKGSDVIVDGKLVQESWEDKDGRRQSRVRIEAARVYFNDGRRQSSGADGQGRQGSQGQAQPPRRRGERDDMVEVFDPAEDTAAIPF